MTRFLGNVSIFKIPVESTMCSASIPGIGGILGEDPVQSRIFSASWVSPLTEKEEPLSNLASPSITSTLCFFIKPAIPSLIRSITEFLCAWAFPKSNDNEPASTPKIDPCLA